MLLTTFPCLADTVVLTHAQPITSDTDYSLLPDVNQELLEKPTSKADNLRMLLDMNGGVCEVVTGVSVGQSDLSQDTLSSHILLLTTTETTYYVHIVYPILTSPGYEIKYVRLFGLERKTITYQIVWAERSIDERSLVYFSDNPRHLIEAYVESGEGLDRAGGFAVQVRQRSNSACSFC